MSRQSGPYFSSHEGACDDILKKNDKKNLVKRSKPVVKYSNLLKYIINN